MLHPIGELSTRFHGHFSDFATKSFTADLLDRPRKIGLGRETFSSKITKVSVKSCKKGLTLIKVFLNFFDQVCNFFSAFDHIHTSEVCNYPYKPY